MLGAGVVSGTVWGEGASAPDLFFVMGVVILACGGLLVQLAASICWLVVSPEAGLRWWAAASLLLPLSFFLPMLVGSVPMSFPYVSLVQISFVAVFSVGAVSSAIVLRQTAAHLGRSDLMHAGTGLAISWVLTCGLAAAMTGASYLTVQARVQGRAPPELDRGWIEPGLLISVLVSIVGTLILGWIVRAVVVSQPPPVERPRAESGG
jgi:hypothetical protein